VASCADAIDLYMEVEGAVNGFEFKLSLTINAAISTKPRPEVVASIVTTLEAHRGVCCSDV